VCVCVCVCVWCVYVCVREREESEREKRVRESKFEREQISIFLCNFAYGRLCQQSEVTAVAIIKMPVMPHTRDHTRTQTRTHIPKTKQNVYIPNWGLIALGSKASTAGMERLSTAYDSIRQHTSAYTSIRQHSSA